MMKKACLILLALSLVFGAVSCKTTTNTTTGPTVTPEWLNDVPPDDVLWGIGTANVADPGQSMTFAIAMGKSSIGSQLNTLVQQMLTDYFLSAGTVENQSTSSLKENVQRQIVNINVSARDIKRWQAPDGRWWMLVEMKKSDAKTEIASILGNEEAAFAQFKAQQALQMLDEQLTKNQKPIVTDYK